jgi:hypothetical protein
MADDGCNEEMGRGTVFMYAVEAGMAMQKN